MGQSLIKNSPESEESKDGIIEKCYDDYFSDKQLSFNEFYKAIYQVVEELNKNTTSLQLAVPDAEKLEAIFHRYYDDTEEENAITEEEFGRLIKEVLKHTRFKGLGFRRMLIYMYGIPLASLIVKKRFERRNTIHDGIFVSGVTSATVYVLAKLNQI